MSADLIDQYIDRQGIRRDTDYMLAAINEVEASLQKLANARLTLGGANSTKELIAALNAVAVAQKQVEASTKQLAAAQKQQSAIELNQAKTKTEAAKASKEQAAATLNEAKATTENAKAKEIEARYIANLTKEKEKLAKLTDAELLKQEKLNSAYAQLNARYKVHVAIAEEMGAKYGIQSEQFTQAATRANKLHTELLGIDQALGNSRRNVGNYTQATFALSQTLREAPAFANSLQTGLMGISNNIPILIDEYKKLKDQTGSASSALGIMGKSVFSLTNMISLGLAVFMILLPTIEKWIGVSKEATEAQKDLSEATAKQNELLKKQTSLIEENGKALTAKLKQEIDHAEKAGASQVTLFAKRKALADEEKKLADQRLIESAQQVAADGVMVKSREQALRVLAGAQQSHLIQYNSYLAQLQKANDDYIKSQQGLNDMDEDKLKKKVEALNAQANTAKAAYEDATDTLTNAFEKQNNVENLATEVTKFNADERRKYLLESARIEADAIEDKNGRVLNNERSTLEQRLAALKSNAAAQRKIIEAEKADVLNNPESSGVDRSLAIKKAAQQEYSITVTTNEEILKVKEQYRMRDLQAQKEALEAARHFEIEVNKELADSALLSLQQRLAAQKKYSAGQRDLLNRDYQFKLQQAGISDSEIAALLQDRNYKVKGKKITDEELIKLEKQYETEVLKLSIDTNKAITDILGKELENQTRLREEQIAGLERNYNRLKNSSTIDYASEVIALNESLDKGLISYRTYRQKREKLDNDYNKKSQDELINSIAEELDLFKGAEQKELDAFSRVQVLKQLYDHATTIAAKKEIADRISEAQKELDAARKAVDEKINLETKLTEAKKKGTEQRRRMSEQDKKDLERAVHDAAVGAIDLANAFGDGGYDKQNNAIREQLQLLDVKTQKEIDAVNQSLASEKEKQDQIAEINARAAAQKESLGQRERASQERQAKFDRDMQALKILGETTYQAIKYGFPINPLGDIIMATGLLEIAALYARPIPKYFRGKDATDNYEGLAVVGDGGKREAIVRESGKVEITPAKDTLTYVGKNDIILPDASMLLDMQMAATKRQTDRILNYSELLKIADNTKQLESLERTTKNGFKFLGQIMKNNRPIIYQSSNSRDIIMGNGSRPDYYNKNLQG